MSDSLEFTVIAKALVRQSRLEEEDRDVAGTYGIYLPAECSAWTQGQQATAVLDEFHESVAVSVLDDFDFSVLNSDGVEIFEDFED